MKIFQVQENEDISKDEMQSKAKKLTVKDDAIFQLCRFSGTDYNKCGPQPTKKPIVYMNSAV